LTIENVLFINADRETTRTFNMEEIVRGRKDDPELVAGDVVYVPESFF